LVKLVFKPFINKEIREAKFKVHEKGSILNKLIVDEHLPRDITLDKVDLARLQKRNQY
jgi:hypothetical protein